MKKRNKLFIVIFLLAPVMYLLSPLVNSFGCQYKSHVETSDLIMSGVCYRGVLRTLTHFKKTGTTISQTMLTSYREPFLRTLSISNEVVSPPSSSDSLDVLNLLAMEYLTPSLKIYHLEHLGGRYIFILQPDGIDVNNDNKGHIYNVALDGRLSYWD